MRLAFAVLVGILAMPSTWLFACVVIFTAFVPPQILPGVQRFVGVVLVYAVACHIVWELWVSVPKLRGSTPPRGLHCSEYEWNNAVIGKPLFLLQLVVGTFIRALTLILILLHMQVR
jgi:hypothetical protein